jgi:hypothetical protein
VANFSRPPWRDSTLSQLVEVSQFSHYDASYLMSDLPDNYFGNNMCIKCHLVREELCSKTIENKNIYLLLEYQWVFCFFFMRNSNNIHCIFSCSSVNRTNNKTGDESTTSKDVALL